MFNVRGWREGDGSFLFVVVADGGRVLAACATEAEAERVAFLAGVYSQAVPRIVRHGAARDVASVRPASPAPVAPPAPVVAPVVPPAVLPGFRVEAAPGVVVGRLGPSGERVEPRPVGEARGVAGPLAAAAPGGLPDPEPEDDGPLASWEAAGGVVVVAPHGRTCRVTFARRPPVETRDGLKAAGFRWLPDVGSWEGAPRALPLALRRP